MILIAASRKLSAQKKNRLARKIEMLKLLSVSVFLTKRRFASFCVRFNRRLIPATSISCQK